MKYTNSPWIIKEQTAAHAMIWSDDNQLVAKVWLTGDEFSNDNAQLIAISPELYEAVLGLYNAIPHGRENWPALFQHMFPGDKAERLESLTNAMMLAQKTLQKLKDI